MNTCQWCGLGFQGRTNRATCSDECGTARRNARRAKANWRSQIMQLRVRYAVLIEKRVAADDAGDYAEFDRLGEELRDVAAQLSELI